MVVDPRKRACEARPSPWYVHPFEAHERGSATSLDLGALKGGVRLAWLLLRSGRS